MQQENAIEVNHISKCFKVYSDKGHELKDHIVSGKRKNYTKREVLKDVSFSVKKGEAIGLVGHNGCGKSTTLKLLTKIMYPDSGTIEMRGRVSSLIELGAGFHPDMSGRENIYINASIFGLTKKEIDRRLDDIIAFSELEGFIDNPVRTYSSGMYMRLAFSVAINVDADILLIDEILAVGDAVFQAKCFNRLREIKAAGTTVVIVSHSLQQIEQFCERSLWIQDGRIQAEGQPREVHSRYLDFMGKRRQKIGSSTDASDKTGKDRWGNGNARITDIRLLGESGAPQSVFKTGESLRIQMDYEVIRPVEDAVFGIGIFRTDGLRCYGTNTRLERFERFDLRKGGCLELDLHEVNLLPGEYSIDLTIECDVGIPVDYYTKALRIEMYSDIQDVGVSRIKHTWTFDRHCETDGGNETL